MFEIDFKHGKGDKAQAKIREISITRGLGFGRKGGSAGPGSNDKYFITISYDVFETDSSPSSIFNDRITAVFDPADLMSFAEGMIKKKGNDIFKNNR